MITVIGAGPAGCYTAYLLAKEGYKVNIYEEHQQTGKPVQCTGIVTSLIKNIIKEDHFVINKIKEVDVFSPNKNCINFQLKNPNLVLDRAKFDSFLAEKAKGEGAKIFFKKRFIAMEQNDVIKAKINNDIIKTNSLIGADGPNSAVAKSAGLFGKRKFVMGHQARIKINCKPEAVEFWLGVGKFAWLVPESEKIARVGVIGEKDVKKTFEKFLKLKGVNKKNIIEYQSGIIPFYNPKQITEKNNVYLIGDAATMVKPTTYGGIIPGLMAAECLKKAVKEKISYEKLWKKKIGKDLYAGLLIRKVMDKFSENDYNQLVKMCSTEEIKQLLETTDRDYATKILIKLLIANPKFLLWGKKLL